ncbi:hypothetical protein BH09VER1_BH09VER1_56110 [soil metagenome]
MPVNHAGMVPEPPKATEYSGKKVVVLMIIGGLLFSLLFLGVFLYFIGLLRFS